MIDTIVFLLGAVIGSFLNVCIVRLPKEESVVYPNSHCPKCKNPIAWFDNIPLISWLILFGRCRSCKASVSFRYWLVELLTAVSFVLFYQYYGLQPLFIAYLVMLSGFIVATFVDFKHRIIPDEVSIGGMWAGIAFSAFIPSLHPSLAEGLSSAVLIACAVVLTAMLLMWMYPFFCKHLMEEVDPAYERQIKLLVFACLGIAMLINALAGYIPAVIADHLFSLAHALTGFIIAGGAIYILSLLGDIIFRKESMGGGDVKLMAMIGAFLGWKLALLAFFIAPFFGAVVGIVEKIRTKDNTIAYGPFLVLGALVSMFWGEQIISFILSGGLSF